MTREQLLELENHLQHAAGALRAAWVLCKHNGMQPTAKELSDTVLDLETARERVSATLRDQRLR